MAELFIAVLGASNFTYADATWTQTLPDWIGAHVRMFRFFGPAPRLLIPDNLKSGVNKPSFYDPEINRSYGKMAAHYPTSVSHSTATQAKRQSQSGGRRALCAVLHSWSAAQRYLLLHWLNARPRLTWRWSG